MGKQNTVSDSQIRRLRSEAFARGDAMQGYICHLALLDEHSEEELSDYAWLGDNTCLDGSERRDLVRMTHVDAWGECARVIGDAAASARADERAWP